MTKTLLNDEPPSMPLLFLDIDGVMNTPASSLANRSGLVFRREIVTCLNRILVQSGCRVVISSSWRKESQIDLRAVFESQGVRMFRARLAGATPDLSNEECWNRGDEIEAWMIHSHFSGRLAILDNDSELNSLDLWHCRTDENKGLTPSIAERVIEMLMDGPVYRQGGAI
jgi:hypothetical protein